MLRNKKSGWAFAIGGVATVCALTVIVTSQMASMPAQASTLVQSEPKDEKVPTIPRRKLPEQKMLTWKELKPEEKSPERKDKVVLTDEQWKEKLTPEQYRILRAHGTEPAFCGVNLDQKGEGIYFCAGCDLELFVSETKYVSGTGWPSFFLPYQRENVWMRSDRSLGMLRVEVLCSRCDGHLGHVFPDGPEPSGLRFCINGNALQFKQFAN